MFWQVDFAIPKFQLQGILGIQGSMNFDFSFQLEMKANSEIQMAFFFSPDQNFSAFQPAYSRFPFTVQISCLLYNLL